MPDTKEVMDMFIQSMRVPEDALKSIDQVRQQSEIIQHQTDLINNGVVTTKSVTHITETEE